MNSDLYHRDYMREQQILKEEAEILEAMDAAIMDPSHSWFDSVLMKSKQFTEARASLKVHERYVVDPIVVAIKYGRAQVIKNLARDRFSEGPDCTLGTLCHRNDPHIALAALTNNFDMVKLLVDSEVFDIDACWNTNDDGVTALTIACRNGNAALAEYLIENGADMNEYNTALNDCSSKPLYHAIRTGLITTINLILKYVNISDSIENGCEECRYDYYKERGKYSCVHRNCSRAFHEYIGEAALFHPIVGILCGYGFYPYIDLAKNCTLSSRFIIDFVSREHSVLIAEMYARRSGASIDEIAAVFESADYLERPLVDARYYLTRDRVRLTKMLWMIRNREEAPLNRWNFPVQMYKWILGACGLFVFANEWTRQ